jgi:hypothetical protein
VRGNKRGIEGHQEYGISKQKRNEKSDSLLAKVAEQAEEGLSLQVCNQTEIRSNSVFKYAEVSSFQEMADEDVVEQDVALDKVYDEIFLLPLWCNRL